MHHSSHYSHRMWRCTSHGREHFKCKVAISHCAARELDDESCSSCKWVGGDRERTGLSRYALYREFSNPRSRDGVVRENPKGRLRVTHIGRSIRVKEADLCAFIEALSN